VTVKNRNNTKKQFVRALRQKATLAEKNLISLLTTEGIKFNFQRAFWVKRFIDGKWLRSEKFYIVDFFLPEYATIIEVDGEYHNNRPNKDIERTLDLIKNAHRGVQTILRFTNKDVVYQPGRVMQTIKSLKPIRLTKGVKGQIRHDNLKYNAETARKNEIASMIKNDRDMNWTQKKALLKEIN